MTRQREDHLTEAKDWLIRLQRWFEAAKALRHQNPHIELENFFRDLLNLTYGWELDNANLLFGMNQDSFDLSDEKSSIAVQVTATTTPHKIRKTLKSFIGKYDDKYKRLIFVYPNIQLGASRADFTADLEGYDFEASRDRLCFGSILQRAQDMEIGDQARLLDLLRKELKPLGAALQIGVDQTLEALIAVIKYMSDHAPIHNLDLDELRPDQKQKLQRFHEHADYLVGQFRMNQALHVTVDQARDAIGYDTVRVAKIQAWLKSNSIEMLDRHMNNAQRAFKNLADDLLKNAHTSGTDAEETAVRFLLADEFIRCNVFPNPTNQ